MGKILKFIFRSLDELNKFQNEARFIYTVIGHSRYTFDKY